MQTVCDLNVRAIYIFGLISKKNPQFLAKLNFYKMACSVIQGPVTIYQLGAWAIFGTQMFPVLHPHPHAMKICFVEVDPHWTYVDIDDPHSRVNVLSMCLSYY